MILDAFKVLKLCWHNMPGPNGRGHYLQGIKHYWLFNDMGWKRKIVAMITSNISVKILIVI